MGAGSRTPAGPFRPVLTLTNTHAFLGTHPIRYSGAHTKNPIEDTLRKARRNTGPAHIVYGCNVDLRGLPMLKPKRVAIYVRVPTDAQTTDPQHQELEAGVERAGHTVGQIELQIGK